ncbi:AraC family transcriptional regulator [Arcobacter sp.]|uniref:AraC family transcriptional regulator n=1 Tax=unclassified Arcobacter TaxID=2593671 RepID=UPI003B00C534
MKKIFTKTFKNKNLPFLELRYSNSNTHYKKHFHDSFSLGVNKKGESLYTNSDKSYKLTKNKLSIMNPHEVHSCNASSEVLNEYYMMHLDTSWCRDIQKLIDEKITSYINVPTHILEDESFYNEYLFLCRYLFEEHSIVDKEDALINFFIKFFSLFLEESQTPLIDKKFELIIKYMNDKYKENISLDDLAKYFELNPFYIIRLFKSNMNLTPRAYLINVKINKSKQFLQDGYSIVDTALECGFFDQSHFHKNFVKIVATTPMEYKLNFVQ